MPSDRHHHSHRRNGRRRHPLHRSYRDFASRRRRGWGFNLYRNTRRGKIGGVAAGLADYWDVAPWVVRLGWIALFLFTGTLALWLYLGAWIALAPRPTRDDVGDAADPDEPAYEDAEVEMEYDERRHHYRPRKVFRYSDSSSVRLQRARERMDNALRRVEAMESYVTSRRYRLNREFSQL